jgi:hypothetical protein
MIFCSVQTKLGPDMRAAVNRVVQTRLLESQQLKAAGNPEWWRLREATLFAIGTQVHIQFRRKHECMQMLKTLHACKGSAHTQ